MSVYLGDRGSIQLGRTGNAVAFLLTPDDVDPPARRFSVDFGGPCPFITGDQVDITRIDGTQNLQLVSGVTERDVTHWVHADRAGGIRLFTTLAAAITGKKIDAVELVIPTEDQQVTMDVANVNYNCVGQIRNYELTTQRETVDISMLGEEFRSRYDQGMISGQGQITAMWDYQFTPCKDLTLDPGVEMANYFAQLVIRFKEGADFKGIFYVFQDDTCDTGVWYEADCIVTNVGMSFAPTRIIDTTVQFVTTGPVLLKMGDVPSFLIQEEATQTVFQDGVSDDLFLLEQPPGSIELETDLD